MRPRQKYTPKKNTTKKKRLINLAVTEQQIPPCNSKIYESFFFYTIVGYTITKLPEFVFVVLLRGIIFTLL